jgi:acyl carrier protein
MENLEEFTIQTIIKHCKNATTENTTLDSKIKSELGGDSLDAIEIVMDLEDKYKFEFPEDRVKEITTVRDVIELTRAAIIAFKAKST